VEHRQSRYLNNRCENSHRPTRQRERGMPRDSCPRMALLPNTADPDGIGCPRRSTARRCGSASRVGLKLQVRSGPPKG
jgi:hypothetical protein